MTNPTLPLAPDELVDVAALGPPPYPTTYEWLLEDLLVEWDRYYQLQQLRSQVFRQWQYSDGRFVIFFDTVATTWQSRLRDVRVPQMHALFPTIVPISVLVVIDQSIKSYYGDDPVTVALKVKRNIELWDAPLTAYFGIFLNVRTVAYLEDTTYAWDTDHGGVPDGWEYAYQLRVSDPVDDIADIDGDNLTNRQEYQHGTNPHKADTDDDGLTDEQEVLGKIHGVTWYQTDPNDADTDDDGLSDGKEHQYRTNPFDPNTDDDYLLDGVEVAHQYDPNDPADPIALAKLKPLSVTADDRTDRVSVVIQGQATINKFKVKLSLYDLSGGSWKVVTMTKWLVTDGNTGSNVITFTVTSAGYYTVARVVIWAYDDSGLVIGAKSSGGYSISLLVKDSSGGGGGGGGGGGTITPW